MVIVEGLEKNMILCHVSFGDLFQSMHKALIEHSLGNQGKFHGDLFEFRLRLW